MKIYVASSWRCLMQQGIVHTLRAIGHDVYDFRNPTGQPGDTGFHWSEVDPEWKTRAWDPDQFVAALAHPIARACYKLDDEALRACDLCVLVLPCGRSAHLEAGIAIGLGKPTAILMWEPEEPELMYLEADRVCTSVDSLLDWCEMQGREGAR